VKDTFYGARALSRAGNDHEAIKRYEGLLKRYPGSGYGEEALYLVGRLHYIIGEWAKAANAYNRYLVRYSKRGQFLKTARYELAVSRLAQKDFAKAETGFDRLVKEEDDRRLLASYRQLLGVARLQTNKDAGKKDLLRVIDEEPLSFAALAARARLEKAGETAPDPLPQDGKDEPPASELSVNLPEKVQLLLRAGLDAEAEAALEGDEQVLRLRHRPREYESLCLAYSEMNTAARRYRVGQQAARWSLLVKPPTQNSRWLWDCVYPRPYSAIVQRVENEFKLPPHLIHSVMRQESTFLPTVVSPANAVGLMQLIEPTAKRVGAALSIQYEPELLRIPSYNIRFGGYYLRRVLDTFGQHVTLAAAAYNAGPIAVSRWLESGEDLPLDVFVARIPYRETRTYVNRVVANLARYAYLDRGKAGVFGLDLEIEKGLRSPPDAY
jgi:soluble lytic murein transglycosylase